MSGAISFGEGMSLGVGCIDQGKQGISQWSFSGHFVALAMSNKQFRPRRLQESVIFKENVDTTGMSDTAQEQTGRCNWACGV